MPDNQNVDINSLVPRKDNPRKGDVEAIKKSLKENGQYRPIVVNSRNNEILAGNHTWQAARELGWDGIAVWYVDVNEEQAKKIVLVDNRANDLASYDDKLLLSLLDELDGDLSGTGFELDDLEDLMASVDGAIETEYEEFGGDYAETAEETAKRYEHRESASEKNEEKRQRVKEIVLVFPEDNFDDFVEDIFELKAKWETGSTSAVVAKAVKAALRA